LAVDLVVFAVAAVTVAAWTLPTRSSPLRDTVWTLLALAGLAAVWLAYESLTSRAMGGTLGKRLLGMHVCDPAGERPRLPRLLGRSLARALSTLPAGVGYVASLWDPGRQTWHDALAGTWVRHDQQPSTHGTRVSEGDQMSDDFQPRESQPREAQPRDDRSDAGDAPAETGAQAPPPPVTEDAGGTTQVTPEGPGPVPVESTETAPAPPPGRPRDPNVDAISRAGLGPDMDGWLREVAGPVDPRLDRVAPGWREGGQPGAARACVFGLMLGRLADDYPHTSGDLAEVAETHPSFATLVAGSRLATLREIAQDRGRGATWIAPLVGLDDPAPLRDILE
jgi:uncharacterized RDD family membrane protein YckC